MVFFLMKEDHAFFLGVIIVKEENKLTFQIVFIESLGKFKPNFNDAKNS